MIILDKKYAIDGTGRNYTLSVRTTCKGEEVWTPNTYHTTLRSALEYYIKLRQVEKISEKTYRSVKEAIEDLKAMEKEIIEKVDL